MSLDFPTPPNIEGFKLISVTTAFVKNRRTGQREDFQVSYYQDIATGITIPTTEDRYMDLLYQLLVTGVLGAKGGEA